MQRLERHYGSTLLDSIHREPDTGRCTDIGIHVSQTGQYCSLGVFVMSLERNTDEIDSPGNGTLLGKNFRDVIER